MWVDVLEQRAICKLEENSSSAWEVLVKEYVFAVGHNSDFIVAKQHPLVDRKPGDDFKINTAITNYFIIDMQKSSDKVSGPFTDEEFAEQRRKLKIEEIEFDMNYPEVP